MKLEYDATHASSTPVSRNLNWPPFGRATPGVTETLLALEHTLGVCGPEISALAGQIRQLRKRLSEGQLHLAVLGQFKRGKSSFLNALLGQPILPTAVVPLTAVPTFLRGGDYWKVKITYEGGKKVHESTPHGPQEVAGVLHHFVTESENPHNKLGVVDVQVFVPSQILQHGVVLIDTPGIGSTFRHNTLATLSFLPQCDAALFLVSADPPITEVELEFLKEVHARGIRLFYIMNKVDYLDAEERQAAVEFFRRVLREHLGNGVAKDEIPVLTVSARLGLKARQGDDHRAWEASGMAEVEERLIEFLAKEKNRALQETIARRAWNVAGDAVMRLQLELKSLEMPLQVLAERMAQFERFLADAKRQKLVADDLLAGDRKRLLQRLETNAEAIRQRARSLFVERIETALKTATLETAEAAAQRAQAQMVPEFFAQELTRLTDEIKQAVHEVLRPHQERLQELIRQIRETAASIFEIPCVEVGEEDYFSLPEPPMWVTDTWESYLGPLPPEMVDMFLPKTWRFRRIRRRLLDRVEKIVIQNVENLRWKLFQGIEDTIRKYSNEMNHRLQETIAATHGAIAATQEQRTTRQVSVEEQKRVLQEHLDRITKLRDLLTIRE